MLNAKIANSILKHVFQTAGAQKIKIGTSSNLSDFSPSKLDTDSSSSPYLKGMEGPRYLALFTKMPIQHGSNRTTNTIDPGAEPWGPWITDGDPHTDWNIDTATKSVTGYLRTRLDGMKDNDTDYALETPSSVTSQKSFSDPVIGKFGIWEGKGNTGITGSLVISNPIISDGTDYDDGKYGREIIFDDGASFIYNSDMIFFPESVEAWGDIIGFGIFNDSGLDAQGRTKVMDSQYYTDHLLFWGLLTPEDGKNFVHIGASEIAIFRNNDFQVSMNHTDDEEV